MIDRIHDKRRESVDGGKDAETLIGIILFACFRMPFRYKQRRIRPWKTVRLGKKENARDVKAGNALKKDILVAKILFFAAARYLRVEGRSFPHRAQRAKKVVALTFLTRFDIRWGLHPLIFLNPPTTRRVDFFEERDALRHSYVDAAIEKFFYKGSRNGILLLAHSA